MSTDDSDQSADDADTRSARLRSQLLSDRAARPPTEIVRHLLAVQAQDGRGARLAVRARSTGLSAADVDAALNRRELVVSWLNRGTLHLVAAEDYWWLHRLTTPQLGAKNATQLRREGVADAVLERAIDVIAGAVSTGPRTRADLSAHLAGADVSIPGRALAHVLVAATLRGLIVRGPMVGPEQAFVSVDKWLGPPPPPLSTAEALARLAHRYLTGHAPASAEDLAKWAGIRLGDARSGLASVGPSPTVTGGLPTARLLGPFDPLLHGWRSRRLILNDETGVITSNGVFRPTALIRGRIAATWTLRSGAVAVRPLDLIAEDDWAQLAEDATDVLRYLGLVMKPGPAPTGGSP